MKAHVIKTLGECILTYKQDENISTLRRIAAAHDIPLKELPEKSAGETVGFLAGYSGFAPNGSSEEASESCIVFSALPNKSLNGFLADLQKINLVIPYKAVITQMNQDWTLTALVEQLKKERARLGE